eukprot:9501362-Pyramimonas_sp.AAC.1
MLYFCHLCCGCSCGGQFRKLRKMCVPEPEGTRKSKYASSVLRALKKGRHPRLVGVTCEVFDPAAEACESDPGDRAVPDMGAHARRSLREEGEHAPDKHLFSDSSD